MIGVDKFIKTFVNLWAESMLMMCPVFEMEFEMALNVSPSSQPRVPKRASGGMAPSRRLWHVEQIGKQLLSREVSDSF